MDGHPRPFGVWTESRLQAGSPSWSSLGGGHGSDDVGRTAGAGATRHLGVGVSTRSRRRASNLGAARLLGNTGVVIAGGAGRRPRDDAPGAGGSELIRAVVRESSYRFRATFCRRWAGYLTLVVLIGLVGGVAMAAVAGARRTQSSFPAYLASTNPSDMQMFTEFAPITGTGYSEKVAAAAARVPNVERAVTVVGFDGNLQVLGRSPSGVPGEAPPALEGSTGSDAEDFATDRVTVLQGRMANPARLDEMVMSAGRGRRIRASRRVHPARGLLHRRAGELAGLRRLPEGQAPPDRPVQARRHRGVEPAGRPGRRRRAGQPDRCGHPRADQAARDVLRLLLLRLVPS